MECADEQAGPIPSSLGTCGGCGTRIAWVRLARGLYRPADVEPHPRGEYILLADGVGVLRVDDERLSPDFAERYRWTRLTDHVRTCPVPSLAAFGLHSVGAAVRAVGYRPRRA